MSHVHPDIPNFSWAELQSEGATQEEVVAHCCLVVGDRFWAHMEKLQALREEWDSPLRITSAWRTKYHNAKVGGAVSSQHLVFATDIVPTLPDVVSKEAVQLREERVRNLGAAAVLEGFDGIGVYPRQGFVHLDLRGSRARWTEK
jgi:uncharacterized protein YcbK (DUF882 family)